MKLYIELYDGTIFEKPINEVKTLSFTDIGGNDALAHDFEQIIPPTPIVEEVVVLDAPVEPIVEEHTDPVDAVVNELFAPVEAEATVEKRPDEPIPTPNASFTEI